MKTRNLEPFKIHLSLTVPERIDEAEVIPMDNNVYEVWFDKGLLATAQKTEDGWVYLDKGEYPTPDFIPITRLIDEHYGNN